MAGLRYRNGAGYAQASSYRYWQGGQWKTPSKIMARINGAWVEVWTAITTGVTGGFNQESAGGLNNRRDRGTFNAYRLPNTAPAITAYQWEYNDDGGQLVLSGNTTSNSLVLIGPTYNPDNFPSLYNCSVRCTVTIGGKQYTTEWMYAQYSGGFA